MKIFENQYIVNILSDFIFLILTTVGVFFLYKCTKRRSLLEFFGLNGNKKVIIYTSNLLITQKGAASDFRGLPRSYTGFSVPYYEVTMLPPLIRLFNVIVPGASSLPGILKALTLSDVEVEYLASPLSESEIDKTNVVIFSFGSPGYNIVSEYIQSRLFPKMLMVKDNMQIIYPKTKEIIEEGRNVAFLQKVFDRENKRWIFYTAGIDENGTKGALFYLIKNWAKLSKIYGNKAFSICFEFPLSREDPKGFNKPRVLKEL